VALLLMCLAPNKVNAWDSTGNTALIVHLLAALAMELKQEHGTRTTMQRVATVPPTRAILSRLLAVEKIGKLNLFTLQL